MVSERGRFARIHALTITYRMEILSLGQLLSIQPLHPVDEALGIFVDVVYLSIVIRSSCLA